MYACVCLCYSMFSMTAVLWDYHHITQTHNAFMYMFILQHALKACSVMELSYTHITQTHNVRPHVYFFHYSKLSGVWDSPTIMTLRHIKSHMYSCVTLQHTVNYYSIVGFP